MEFVTLSKEEFREFSKNHPMANFMQTTELGDLKSNNGIKVDYVGVKENNNILMATLLEEEPSILGKKVFYAPRGFLVDYHDKKLLSFFVTNLKEFVKKRKGFKIIIDPNLVYQVRDADGSVIDEAKKDDESFKNLCDLGFEHFGFNLYLEARQVRFAYRMMLDAPYDIKKLEFSKSTRKNLESTYKKGLSVRKGGQEDLPIMEELFKDTATRKDFFYRKLDYYREMYKYMGELMTIYFAYLDPEKYLECAKENLKEEEKKNNEILSKMEKDMIGSKLKSQKESSDKRLIKLQNEVKEAENFKKEYPNGKDIACLLSMWNGDEFLTLTSGSLEKYRKFTPKYAMYDAHIKDAYKRGYKACNFYGISGNFKKENNPLYGVYEFKRGFGGNVIEYIGEFTLPVTSFNKFYNFMRRIKRTIKRK